MTFHSCFIHLLSRQILQVRSKSSWNILLFGDHHPSFSDGPRNIKEILSQGWAFHLGFSSGPPQKSCQIPFIDSHLSGFPIEDFPAKNLQPTEARATSLEIVIDLDPVSQLQKHLHQVAADEATATGHQDRVVHHVLRASQGFIYSLTTWKLRKKKATHEETKPATFPHIQIIVYTVSHTKVCAHVVIILYI